MPRPGDNAGVSGVIYFKTDAAANGTAKIFMKVVSWGEKIDSEKIDAYGRGGGKFRTSRRGPMTAGFTFKGNSISDAFHLPDTLNDLTGTCEVDYDLTTGKKDTFPVRVWGVATGYNDKKNEQEVSGWAEIIDYPVQTLTSGENQPTVSGGAANLPTTYSGQIYTSIQKYAGSSFTLDLNALQTAAMRYWLFVHIGDTDAAEAAALAVAMAAMSAPGSGLKKRPATLVRSDSDYCIVSVPWGLTDTKDDVVLPRRTTFSDTGGLSNRITKADINATPSGPSGNYTLTHTGHVLLNDGSELITPEYGQYTSKSKTEEDATFTFTDPTGISSFGAQGKVYWTVDTEPADNTFTTPSGQKIIGRHTRPLTDFQSLKTLKYGTRDSNDERQFPGTIESIELTKREAQKTVIVGCNTGDTVRGIINNQSATFNGGYTFAAVGATTHTYDGMSAIKITDTLAEVRPRYVYDHNSLPGGSPMPSHTDTVSALPWDRGKSVTGVFLTPTGQNLRSSTVISITFSGGGGTGAAATAHMFGTSGGLAISFIEMTNQGSGYTSVPTVLFDGAAGTPAYGQATVSTAGDGGWGLPYAKVFTAGSVPNGNIFSTKFERREIERTRGAFVFITRHMATPAEKDTLMTSFRTLQNKTNTIAFMGKPAHTLLYGEPSESYLYDGTNTRRPLRVAHACTFDSLLHQKEDAIPVGWIPTAGGFGYGEALGSDINPYYVLKWPDEINYSTVFGATL